MPKDTTYHTLHTPAVTEDLIDPREQKIRRLTAQVAELEQTNRRLTERLGEIQRLAAGALTEAAELPEKMERPAEPVDGEKKGRPENKNRIFSWKRRQKKDPAADRTSAVAGERTGWRRNLNLPVALTVLAATILMTLFFTYTHALLRDFELEEVAEYLALGLLLGLLVYVCIQHTQSTRAAAAVCVLLVGVLLFLMGFYPEAPALIISVYLVLWPVSGLIRWKFGDSKKPVAAAAVLCGMIAPIAAVVYTQGLAVLADSVWLVYCASYALCLFGLTRIRARGENRKPFWILFGVVAAAACGLGIYIAAALR